jgi:hypothetical protein
LYYPWIDIKDEAWLKNVSLYWDEIRTIVPRSIDHPYGSSTARVFETEGVLSPLYVSPEMREIDALSDDVLGYLRTPAGMAVLTDDHAATRAVLHGDKISARVYEMISLHKDSLAPEALGRLHQHEIRRTQVDRLHVDVRFASFYLTLLATTLASKNGLALLSDNARNVKLADSANRGAETEVLARLAGTKTGRANLGQTGLLELVMSDFGIDPSTPVKKILKFRQKHASEIGRFRTKIGRLVSGIEEDCPLEALSQRVKDLYVNEVLPAFGDLKAGLKDCQINWAAKHLPSSASFSVSSTSVPLVLVGLAVPQAILVGAGVSLVASAVIFNRKRSKLLRDNPFSYLFSIERGLRGRSRLL